MTAEDKDRVTFRQVLSRPGFVRLWLAGAVSAVGDRLTDVALFVYVAEVGDGSATSIGIYLACRLLPAVMFGPFVGVFVDRHDKRATMVACDFIRAGVLALLPFVSDARLAYVTAFALAAVTMAFDPARQAALPELLERKEEILVANSVMWSTKFFTDLVGYSLAGTIVALTGVKVAFVLDALSFVVSALFLVGIAESLAAVTASRDGGAAAFWRQLKAGVAYHRDNPTVLSLLILFTAGILWMAGLNNLLMVAVDRLLQVPKYWWGFLCATQAVTMFSTAMAIGRWAQKTPRPRLILPGFLGVGLATIAYSLNRSLPVAFVLYAVIGVANAALLTPAMAWLQEIVPYEFRGRVMALRTTVLNFAALPSYLLAGILGDRLGVGPVLTVIGVLICLTAVACAPLPGFRPAHWTSAAKLAE